MNNNNLHLESSPYLLQHAQNPVHWQAWSDEAFEQAKEQSKLVLISIGYSACHWCHVMEHECFEDFEVADYMNKHFINIKVDREERPDVDQVYMEAVQLMTQQGGWPLNCFATADGRPIYGGTYFPKKKWMDVMSAIVKTAEREPIRIEEYAQKLSKGIIDNGIIKIKNEELDFKEILIQENIEEWSNEFDWDNGGLKRAPKFPLPNHLSFLLAVGARHENERILNYTELTLHKMAMGGIYDQIGGGFSRYAVDEIWKVPHFEKMLYDNGQLLSLYANAYKYFKNPYYKEICHGIVDWLKKEMVDDSGAFYSALDADSEGEEGKYYCWTSNELKELLLDNYEWVADYYNVNQNGFWEKGKNILLKTESDGDFIKKMKWSQDEFNINKSKVIKTLNEARDLKIKPGLDNKKISSWNGIMLKGLCDAFTMEQDASFLKLAISNAEWILNEQITNNTLIHCQTNTKNIEGFLEDYAFVVDAFIALYQITLEEKWLEQAKKLTEKSLELFLDTKSKMMYFTAKDTSLIARKMEVYDSVIPSSNSVMATNIFLLGHFYRKDEWIKNAEQMTKNMFSNIKQYAPGFSNWSMLMTHLIYGIEEFCITGVNAKKHLHSFASQYHAGRIICGGTDPQIPIAEYKGSKEKTLLYKCIKGRCLSPLELKI
tara:strand:+ start:1509 stop:3485 length:1977 start_codon:yes stop_codon:yes gene_type:complete